MVWVRVAFHGNDGNHENDENDEDNSDSYKQGVECWIRENHGNHENDENHENPLGVQTPSLFCVTSWGLSRQFQAILGNFQAILGNLLGPSSGDFRQF